MKKFLSFIKNYNESKLFLKPHKLIKSQQPYLDAEMKDKTNYYKDISSYKTPVFKISLKIPGNYLEEIKTIPGFEKIDEEVESLKQKARENKVEIQTNKDGGVEFYRKLYYADIIDKSTAKDALRLSELAIQKKYIENNIKQKKLNPQIRRFLQDEFYSKHKEISNILDKIINQRPKTERVKPDLKIV